MFKLAELDLLSSDDVRRHFLQRRSARVIFFTHPDQSRLKRRAASHSPETGLQSQRKRQRRASGDHEAAESTERRLSFVATVLEVSCEQHEYGRLKAWEATPSSDERILELSYPSATAIAVTEEV